MIFEFNRTQLIWFLEKSYWYNYIAISMDLYKKWLLFVVSYEILLKFSKKSEDGTLMERTWSTWRTYFDGIEALQTCVIVIEKCVNVIQNGFYLHPKKGFIQYWRIKIQFYTWQWAFSFMWNNQKLKACKDRWILDKIGA